MPSRMEKAELRRWARAAILDNSHHTIESGLTAVLEILKQQGLVVTE